MDWTAIMTQQPAETPQGRRRERIAARLRETLAALEADPGTPVTVAALTRMARVSRNALYANHRPVLEALRAIQVTRRPVSVVCDCVDAADSRAMMNARLRALATQNAGLLQRALVAEELAARLEGRNAELVRTLDAMCKPVVVSGREPVAGKRNEPVGDGLAAICAEPTGSVLAKDAFVT